MQKTCKEFEAEFIAASKRAFNPSKADPLEWNDVTSLIAFVSHARSCRKCGERMHIIQSLIKLVKTPFELTFVLDTLRVADAMKIPPQEVVKLFREWAEKERRGKH